MTFPIDLKTMQMRLKVKIIRLQSEKYEGESFIESLISVGWDGPGWMCLKTGGLIPYLP